MQALHMVISTVFQITGVQLCTSIPGSSQAGHVVLKWPHQTRQRSTVRNSDGKSLGDEHELLKNGHPSWFTSVSTMSDVCIYQVYVYHLKIFTT